MTWKTSSDAEAAAPPPDLAAHRRERLGTMVESRRVVRLEELSTALGVSQSTIRRDLDELETAGRLRRVHGGAIAADARLDEPHFDAKAATATDQKLRIAQRAVELLGPDDTVYLDSGSTVLAAARLLAGWNRLTVVTNSLPAANELVGRGPRLILIGGELRSTSRALVGPLTRLVLDDLHVDRALMGTFAISLEDGLATTDPSEAFTKRLVMERAREVILLADSHKMGTRSFVNAGSIDDIDIIVTDTGIDERTARLLKRRGIRVIVA